MKLILSLLILLSFSIQSFSQIPDTAYYSVVKSGTISGEQKSWHISPHQINFTYYYNDRGRGDSVKGYVETNNKGLVTSLHIEGVDYFKNPYTEDFTMKKDSVVWTVNDIRKAKKFDDQFYYSSLFPEMDGMEINWLIKQPGMKGNILPDNTVRTSEPRSKSITYEGRSAELILYSVYFDTMPSPYYVWMFSDGKMFGTINSWFSVVRKGYEAWVDTLNALQEAADEIIYSRQMKELSRDMLSDFSITHANVFQSSDASILEDMTVEISKGTIVDIYPSLEIRNTQVDTVIDASGKFLMPGLWDMHSHYGKGEGVWYLAGGVTHVRDMGNSKILLMYKDLISENKMLGPDISFTSGFIDKADRFQAPTGKMISSLDEGIETINEYKQLGYDQIKLYSSIKPEWVSSMSEYAHSLGMKVCGHIPSFMTAEQAIKVGYNEITHMNFIFLNFMGDTIDTRTPLRFRMVGDNAFKINLESPEVKLFVGLMKEKSISLDATMNIFGEMLYEFKNDTSAKYKQIINWMPEYMKSNLENQTPFGNDDQKSDYQLSYLNMLKMLKLLYDNGILLVAGTDGGQAIALHHELELYVEAGIPANEVLKIATYNAALNCNLQNQYGEIRTGRVADIILVDGNPMKNISDIRRVEWVMKNNKLYYPKQLLATQGWGYYR